MLLHKVAFPGASTHDSKLLCAVFLNLWGMYMSVWSYLSRLSKKEILVNKIVSAR